MKKNYIWFILVILIFLGKFFWRTTEKEMNILDLDQDEKTGLVYIKDSKKLFTGIGKTYYESGKLETICRFKDGVLKGNGISYYESGKIKLTFHYSKGSINGPTKSYYESGKLETEKNFIDGKLDGSSKGYYENDKIAYEENYLNGKLNGNSKFYYENGNLKAELFYKNDMLDGTVIEYLEDGKKTSVTFDFSESSKKDSVPAVMEKDGITLKLSAKPGKDSSPKYTELNKLHFLKLDSDGILTLEGEATITSIVIIILDERRRLKVYNDNSKVSCVKASNRSSFYKQEWTGEADRVSFEALGSQGVYINSIKVTFNKDISLAVSSAERATLYYSDRSFIIPEGVVARTYKIEGNVLSRSREYKKGDVHYV